MTVMSLVARHNTASKNVTTLYIHEPNRRTLEGYARPYVNVVRVCIDCPTFREDGSVGPAAMRYEFVPPLFVNDPRVDTRMIVDAFREATSNMVGDRYRHGVKVRSWRAQMAKQRRASLPTRTQPATRPEN